VALSRLGLRLTGSFALAFLAGLTLLNATSFLVLRHESAQRLTRRTLIVAQDVIAAIQREAAESPAEGIAGAAHAALEEWPAGPEAIAIYDDAGRRIAATGDSALLRAAPLSWPTSEQELGPSDIPTESGVDARLTRMRAAGSPAFGVAVLSSTAQVRAETETLAWWLALSTPIVIVLSLAAGYLLARRSLAPIDHLAGAIGTMAPEALHQRLPLNDPPDEIDRVAEQFNGLLDRLEEAQARNRRFLRQAAHQIKTPLTLVLGEAALSLDRPRTADAYQAALRRVRVAAEQMQRRVDELLLLAHAEAGERPPLGATVELDGVVLECSDLMRGRATALGRHLELVRVEPVAVRGNEELLREAAIELLENACRHAAGSRPIGISAWQTDGEARLEVTSDGPVLAPTERSPENGTDARGLGLTIVSWIAKEHGGRLAYDHIDGVNRFAVVLPAAAASPTDIV
jgi:signal transduction histidine kinase